MKNRSKFQLEQDDYIVEQKHFRQAKKVMNDKDCDRKLEKVFRRKR